MNSTLIALGCRVNECTSIVQRHNRELDERVIIGRQEFARQRYRINDKDITGYDKY